MAIKYGHMTLMSRFQILHKFRWALRINGGGAVVSNITTLQKTRRIVFFLLTTVYARENTENFELSCESG